MAETIRGINVVIGAETTGLSKALSDVNKRSKDIQSELKQVERLLKLDPSNTELLSQKQKLLADAVTNTRDKLDRLRTAQEQVNDQFGRGEISEGQYRAFQREVASTEQQLKRFEQQLKETEPAVKSLGERMSEAGEKMKSAGQKMQDAGKNLSTYVTAPIVAIGAAALKAGVDFEASMSEVQAISGASADDLEALTDKAKEMGATTKFSATQSAEALKYMAMAGWDTASMLDGLDGVMMLAAASGEDLGTVSDIVTDSMTAFGLAASEAGQFADVLAAASSRSNTNVAMLGESFKYVAPVAGALGYSAEDVAIALGLMANAGIKSSQSGTALRSALTNLVNPTDGMATVMSELGISITDSEGQMLSLAEIMEQLRGSFGGLSEDQQAAYAAMLFGKEAMSGMLAIINTSAEDYEKLAESIYDSGGAAQTMSDIMMDNTMGSLTQLMSAIEGLALQIADILMPAFHNFIGIIRQMVDWLAGLDPAIQQTIVVIGGIAAAIGPILVVLGALANSIGSIMTLFGTLSAALAAAGGASAVFGTAIAAITGPVGIAVAAIAGIVTILGVLYKENDDFRSFVDETWIKIKDTFTQAVEAIRAFVEPYIKDMVSFFGGQLDELRAFWDENGEAILLIVKTIFEQIRSNIEMFMGLIKGIFQVAWPIISNTVKVAFEAMKAIVSTVLDLIKGNITFWIKVFQGDWKGAWETVQQTFRDIWDNIQTFLKNINLKQIGKDIIQGLIDGIGSMASAVAKKVQDIASSIPSGVKDFLGIRSPSRVMMGLGVDTAEGLALGMRNAAHEVSRQAEALAQAAVPSIGAAGVPDTSTAAGPGVSMQGMFAGASFHVRNDSDIEAIALAIERRMQIASSTYGRSNGLAGG